MDPHYRFTEGLAPVPFRDAYEASTFASANAVFARRLAHARAGYLTQELDVRLRSQMNDVPPPGITYLQEGTDKYGDGRSQPRPPIAMPNVTLAEHLSRQVAYAEAEIKRVLEESRKGKAADACTTLIVPRNKMSGFLSSTWPFLNASPYIERRSTMGRAFIVAVFVVLGVYGNVFYSALFRTPLVYYPPNYYGGATYVGEEAEVITMQQRDILDWGEAEEREPKLSFLLGGN